MGVIILPINAVVSSGALIEMIILPLCSLTQHTENRK